MTTQSAKEIEQIAKVIAFEDAEPSPKVNRDPERVRVAELLLDNEATKSKPFSISKLAISELPTERLTTARPRTSGGKPPISSRGYNTARGSQPAVTYRGLFSPQGQEKMPVRI